MKDQEALLERVDAVSRTLEEVSKRLGRLERAALPFDFGSDSSEESARIGGLLTVANDSIRRLAAGETQPEILGEYLELASAWAPRCVLFLKRGENLVPWRAVGLDLDDLARVKMDDENSLLARSVRERSLVYAEDQRVSGFGWSDESTLPAAAVAIPLCFDDLVPVVLYADSSESFSPAGLEFLSLLAIQVLKNHALQQGHFQTADVAVKAAPAPATPADAEEEEEFATPAGDAEGEVPDDAAGVEEEPSEAGEDLQAEPEPDEVSAVPEGESPEDAKSEEESVEQEHSEEPEASEPEVEPTEAEGEAVEAAAEAGADQVADEEPGEEKDFEVLREEALRFARLLVSEIKLYNSEVVDEGRQAGDIYDRLRHDIDRSWEMYRRRAHPRVRSEEDCFDAEVVRILASGERKLLGQQYPGPRVD